MTPADAATIQALIEGVHAAEAAADRTWGSGRLPLLVDDDLRARFRRQEAAWRETIDLALSRDVITGEHLATATGLAAAMQRGWAALDAAASEAGHRPTSPEVWEVALHDGSVAALVRDDADASLAMADGRHLHCYTLAEVANIIAALPAAVCAAKREFPGAHVEPPRYGKWPRGGDPVPF